MKNIKIPKYPSLYFGSLLFSESKNQDYVNGKVAERISKIYNEIEIQLLNQNIKVEWT